ncbi:hypothetical protein GCM10017674_27340 [Streptomyces gardneri]|nr:hypothetical protein GCM10017674_27340 [Streptomyces gardneri]
MANISVSMLSELLGVLRTRTGKRGVSAYATAAVRTQPAMDGLAEIVASCEAELEPLSENEVQAVRRDLFGDAPAPYAPGDSAAGRDPRPGPWFWLSGAVVAAPAQRPTDGHPDQGRPVRRRARPRVGPDGGGGRRRDDRDQPGGLCRREDRDRPAALGAIPVQVHDVTQVDSFTAVQLMSDAGGLHGHKCAIGALVAAMALRSAAPLERGLRPRRLVETVRRPRIDQAV